MGRIDTDTLRSAVRAIDDLYAELRVIGIDDTLARSAGELAELHGLRGYDAVHLASAISVEDAGLVAVTWITIWQTRRSPAAMQSFPRRPDSEHHSSNFDQTRRGRDSNPRWSLIPILA